MNENVLYEHRQIGWAIIIITAVIILGICAGTAVLAPKREFAPLLPLVVLTATLVLFSSLTVRVTDSYVAWWFGISSIGRRISLSEIESVSAIKTNILEGWGIHLTWHGWVWNISGFNAVHIKLRSGTRFAVGTPEPKALIAAIERARGDRISA